MVSNYRPIQYDDILYKDKNLYLWMCTKFVFHAIGSGHFLHFVRISFHEQNDECQFSLEIDVNNINIIDINNLQRSLYDFSIGFFESATLVGNLPNIFEHKFIFKNDSFKLAEADNFYFFKKVS